MFIWRCCRFFQASARCARPDSGMRVAGVTLHMVGAGMDDGPIRASDRANPVGDTERRSGADFSKAPYPRPPNGQGD